VLSLSAHSLLRYSESMAQLEIDFSSYSIHDTWIPFKPATADITNNRLRFWTQGELLQCVIASMSIPGILPPVRMEDGSIHVDGSVMDNLPIDEARRGTAGCVIAISLDHGEGQRVIPTLATTSNKLMRWLAKVGWATRSLPLITDTIMYSILGAARQKSDDAEHLADILLKPDVMSIGLLEWGRFLVALEAGYQEARNNQAALKAIHQSVNR
jgi:NTE family protein